MIVDLQKDWDLALDSCIKALKENKLIIYPTDTLYGIGCNASSDEAVKSIYAVKKRELSKPFSVMVSGLKMLLDFFEPTGEELIVISKYLPGPYSFILKARKRLLFGIDEISVRVPQHYFCRKLCDELGSPIVTTSANLSGDLPCFRFEDLDEKILEKVAISINGGETIFKEGSTVINIRQKEILRKGAGVFSFNDY